MSIIIILMWQTDRQTDGQTADNVPLRQKMPQSRAYHMCYATHGRAYFSSVNSMHVSCDTRWRKNDRTGYIVYIPGTRTRTRTKTETVTSTVGERARESERELLRRLTDLVNNRQVPWRSYQGRSLLLCICLSPPPARLQHNKKLTEKPRDTHQKRTGKVDEQRRRVFSTFSQRG